MGFQLALLNDAPIQKQSVDDIIRCNALTECFGLALTKKQAIALAETCSFALKENGRIEFGGGIIQRMIKEFCNSPYIFKQNYEETLHALVEMFYYYKNETMDLISDDALISYMKASFDGICQGSLALLRDRELYNLARSLRFGHPPKHSKNVPPANLEDGFPADLEDGFPADLEDGFPADLEDGFPADPEDGFPADPEDGFPADPEDGFPADPEDGFPADLGDGFPADPEDGFPVDPEDHFAVQSDILSFHDSHNLFDAEKEDEDEDEEY